MTLAELRHEYRPYDTLPEFDDAFLAYVQGLYSNPWGLNTVSAQAWDRGQECASRWKRLRWDDHEVFAPFSK